MADEPFRRYQMTPVPDPPPFFVMTVTRRAHRVRSAQRTDDATTGTWWVSVQFLCSGIATEGTSGTLRRRVPRDAVFCRRCQQQADGPRR